MTRPVLVAGGAGYIGSHVVRRLLAAGRDVVVLDSLCTGSPDLPAGDDTYVRDYVHVDDVAEAHVNAVSYLDEGGCSVVLNCGSGRGHSVREVLHAVEIESGNLVPACFLPRRPEHVPFMVASNQRIRETLGWVPVNESLIAVVRSAFACEREE